MTESYPSLIEGGVRKKIEATILGKIATALGVSLDWLVNGGDAPSLTPFPPGEVVDPESPTDPDGVDPGFRRVQITDGRGHKVGKPAGKTGTEHR